jgi:hypothetical protein
LNYISLVIDNNLLSILPYMLRSISENCKDCKVRIGYYGIDANRLFDTIPLGLNCSLEQLEDDNMIYNKLKRICDHKWEKGDKIFSLDVDTIIQADIFEAIDGTFDFGYTTREYPYWAPINEGVWCLEYNERSTRFLKFFLDQVTNPTWEPFINFSKKFGHDCKGKSWFSNQDFLCAQYLFGIDNFCRIKDIGWQYNYCPSVEECDPKTYDNAKEDIISAFGSKNIKILHFKGRLKNIMCDYYA